MSAERCPECDAVSAACTCTPSGYDPLRIRPYAPVPQPGAGNGAAYPQHLDQRGGDVAYGAAPGGVGFGGVGFGGGAPGEAATEMFAPVPAGGPQTPAFGTAVPGRGEQTVQLRAVPPGAPRAGSAPRGRRLVPLVAGGGVVAAAAVVALGFGLFTGSGDGDAVLLDPKPSAPAITEAPVGPSDGPTGPTPTGGTPSATAGASRSASPSRSASASASRSSAPPPSPSASRTRPASPTPPPPPKPATLRSGDSGPEVEKLQRLLADQGLYRGRFDGKYGRSVEHAVMEFQLDYDIEDDPLGVYGPATRRALEG
ncbi:peptidoglycan-binding protein [Streptomyces sp. NPDC059564]|uniref:peptidoglycan-binding domain-containing protein n=1 Tax=Streptomyces sp. NPDC059564 TaxID=3346865 RepID=UPI0036CB4298